MSGSRPLPGQPAARFHPSRSVESSAKMSARSRRPWSTRTISASHLALDKDDVGSRDNRPEPRSYFIARSPSEWMIFEQPARRVDFASNIVGVGAAGSLRVIVPDFGKVGACFRRPDNRSPTAHAADVVDRGILQYRGVFPRRPPTSGYPCRSPGGAAVASPHGTAAGGLSPPGQPPGGFLVPL